MGLDNHAFGMQPVGPVRRLVLACHPAPALAVTALATALAASVDARPVRVALAFLAGQLSVGWSNDWIDAERDRAVARPDKPVVQGLPVSTVSAAALLAAAACVPLSLALGWRAGIAHLVAVASAWAYNLGLKATIASFAPYALSFGLVPNVVTLVEHRWAPWWATTAGALLGVGAHAANVLPDLAQDAQTGVRGLPQRLGARGASWLAGGCLMAASLVLSPLAVVPAVLLFAAGLARGGRAVFLSTLAVAAVDVGLLLLRGADLLHGG
ncbi:MAG: prenyltransferase [Frankiales bacterium]|nr:prenyltransferase [Frankiales bacterium]